MSRRLDLIAIPILAAILVPTGAPAQEHPEPARAFGNTGDAFLYGVKAAIPSGTALAVLTEPDPAVHVFGTDESREWGASGRARRAGEPRRPLIDRASVDVGDVHPRLTSLPDSQEQPDLPGMIDVVGGDAADHPNGIPPVGVGPQLPGREGSDDGAQLLVLALEDCAVLFPILVGSPRPHEPVAARERERAPTVAGEPPPNDVLPVGAVQRQLPGVVPVGRRPPRRLVHRHAAQRPPQRRAVPRLSIKRLVEAREQQLAHFIGISHITSISYYDG